jgi:hypothetical protein
MSKEEHRPMTMKLRASVLAAVAAVLLVGAFAGTGGSGTVTAQEATPTATPITTGNMTVIAINQEHCFLLLGARGGTAATIGGVSCPGLQSQGNLDAVAGALAGLTGPKTRPQPEDFAGIDLDGNQVHQQDGFVQSSTTGSPGNLFIIAFVPNAAPVHFHTNSGVFMQFSGGDPTGQDWTCDTAAEDPDCVSGNTGGDGVVVARLRANNAIANGSTGAITTPATIIAPTGVGTVTLDQGSTDFATIKFKVVGEPRTLSFITLETKLQDGITDPATQCPLPTDANGFLGGNSLPTKSIVLAVASDIDGTPITGAIVNWSTSDKNIGVMAAPLTPTLDLGSFGFGAPNMLCGTTNPGTVSVTAKVSRDVNLGTTFVGAVDPGAQLANLSKDFTVVGAPASVTLAADPATIACDGTATSKVTATVMDAAGNPSAAGQEVHFDVQTLGTSNPVVGKTDDKGVVTSDITPLSSLGNGVPVVVTAGNAANSVLINCSAGGAATPTPPTGTTGGAGGPSGVPITGPNTGTGATADAGSAEPTWIYLLALSALGLLTGSALVWTGARAKGR